MLHFVEVYFTYLSLCISEISYNLLVFVDTPIQIINLKVVNVFLKTKMMKS